jgi:IMP dehydrogenase
MNIKECLAFDDINLVPKLSNIRSRSECNVGTMLTKNFKLNIPIIASPMDTVCDSAMAARMFQLGGLGIVHRFLSVDNQYGEICTLKATISKEKLSSAVISAAIGAKGDYLERAEILVKSGVNVLLIDVAHGHHIIVKEAIKELKSKFPHVDLIAGSVATAEGTADLIEWGADAVRVGIGNGSMCETRIRSAIGIPQVTALTECCQIAREYGDIPIIADGGMRTPGDICKALALGASTVMLGSLLSGTKESPGPVKRVGMWPNEQLFKEYRGSASLDSKLARGEGDKNVEGNSKIIPYKGKVERVVNDILDGVRSCMSYVDARNIPELHKFAEFVKVTHAGSIEAKPHLMLD